MYRNQKPTVLVPVQKQIPFFGTALNLVEALLRSKNLTNTKDSFDQIHRNSIDVHKRSLLFAKTMNKFVGKKSLANKKFVIGVLCQVRISEILTKREKVEKMKEKCKNDAGVLIGGVLVKNLKHKLLSTLLTLKQRSLLKKQRTTFKLLKLINSQKSIENRHLRNAFKLIKLESFNFLAKYKRCFVIDRLYTRKRLENLSNALLCLRAKPLTNPTSNHPQTSNKSSSPQPTLQSQQTQLIKQLQAQKRTLQQTLSTIKSTNRTTFNTKQTQLQKIESQYESLKFSFGLIEQDNTELAETIRERESLAQEMVEQQRRKKELGGREEDGVDGKQVGQFVGGSSEGELWKAVFDNLVAYLYSVKMGHEDGFSLEKALQKLTSPLSRLSVYPSPSQLQQQNTVLSQLLASYRQILLHPNHSPLQSPPIPLQILKRQRKQLYLALQCLSRWGTTEQQGLQEMRGVVERLRGEEEV